MGYDCLPQKHISDRDYEVWMYMRQPYVATFELTPKCNFRCIHCYLGVHREEDFELTFQQVLTVLDRLADAGVLHLALTGGECTLRNDFCEIYRYAKKKGFLVTVFTNASLISEEILYTFEEYPPFSVEISLYGSSEETYRRVTKVASFSRVYNNLRKLEDKRIPFTLKTPVMIQNHGDQESMENIAADFGQELIVGFTMTPTIDRELYPEDFVLGLVPRFLREVRSNGEKRPELKEADIENPLGDRMDSGKFVPKYICNPGVNDVFIDYMGNVAPCVAHRSKGICLLDYEFLEIWDQFACYKKFPAEKGNKCVRCDCRYFCSICIGEQENIYGDSNRIPWDVCVYAKARKMYYKDKTEVEKIVAYLRKQEFLRVGMKSYHT